MEQQFTSAQVVRLTGITPRQLQWWDERGIVVPKREGRRRLYSAEDITEIAVICALRRKGFPLQKVRRIMKFLQRELGRRLAEAVSNGSDYHLRSEERRVGKEGEGGRAVEGKKGGGQAIGGVCT